MQFINELILIGALLLLLGVVASALSSRIGMPLLLVFLLVGMLAGEDGLGGIIFDDANIAFLIGNITLAVILLDGGLNTRAEHFRTGLRPALMLSTVGVLLTAGIVAAFAWLALDVPLPFALLIGAVVSSTDAAAVFGLLAGRGLRLKQRVEATLEIESGSNDPMAVLLTLAFTQWIVQPEYLGWPQMLRLFALQLGLGLLGGWLGGRLLSALIARLRINRNLYPLLVLTGGITLFGAVNALGGSGFLAIYLAGVVIANSQAPHLREIQAIHVNLAWLSQSVMFLMLGLLATPSNLIEHAGIGLAVAFALMLLARPLAVAVCLTPFRFPWREQLFISWVGLRGAVPIILALFPLLAQIDEDRLFMDVAFFVVLVSLLIQGWTVTPLARWMKLDLPPLPIPDQRVELQVGAPVSPLLLNYQVHPGSALVGQPPTIKLKDVRIVGWFRHGQLLQDPAQEQVQPGDVIAMLAYEANSTDLSALFAPAPEEPRFMPRVFYGEFTLKGDADLAQVAALYGFQLPQSAHGKTVAEWFEHRFHHRPVEGDRVRLGAVELVVQEMQGGDILRAGLKLSGDK